MTSDFSKRSEEVKAALTSIKDSKLSLANAEPALVNATKINILESMQSAVRELESLRKGSNTRAAIDMSFSDYAQQKWGFSVDNNGRCESFFDLLGINTSVNSIESLYSMNEVPTGYRWIIPEVIREAIRTGLRKAPIYQNFIASETTVTQPSIIMPSINMSDASATIIGEARSIPMGQVSFSQKTVNLDTIGIGLKVTDEVAKYSSIDMLSIFLQDVGVKLGMALDAKAIDVLINGDQAGGTESAATVGVNTVNTLAYKDILKAWIRMGRIGRMPAAILSAEGIGIDVLELAEFKGFSGNTTTSNINIKTPVPANQSYYIHGAMPSATQIMLVDPTSALIKLNAQALQVESERIVEKRLTGSYATVVTGFASLFRDARVIIDRSLDVAGAGAYPAWLDPTSAEAATFNAQP
jgi:HK97 family phage major capsid protein